MSIHEDTAPFLLESLEHTLAAAKWCIETKIPGQELAVHGYPAAMLLCAMTAALGRWVHESDAKGDDGLQFARILENKNYYGLEVDEPFGKEIYKWLRGPLLHEGLSAHEVYLLDTDWNGKAVTRIEGVIIVDLRAYWTASRRALDSFTTKAQGLIKDSKRHKDSVDGRVAELAGEWSESPLEVWG